MVKLQYQNQTAVKKTILNKLSLLKSCLTAHRNIDKKQIVIDGCASLGYHYINIELYKDIIAKVRIKLEK